MGLVSWVQEGADRPPSLWMDGHLKAILLLCLKLMHDITLSSDGSEEAPDCPAACQEEAEVEEEEELLSRAIALSLEGILEDDEDNEELLKQAIALSLSD